MGKEEKQLKVFGYGLAAILTFIFFKYRPAIGGPELIGALLTAAILTLTAVSFFHYRLLKGFYAGWMRVARVISICVTTVILSVIYFTLFSIVGILRRILGKDFLEERIKPQAVSYWVKKPQKAFEKKQYTKQF